MYYLYIAFNQNNKLHSIGITTDLKRRLKTLQYNNANEHFKYKIVYYEIYEDSLKAIERENKFRKMPFSVIKKLVTENNPLKIDLSNIETN